MIQCSKREPWVEKQRPQLYKLADGRRENPVATSQLPKPAAPVLSTTLVGSLADSTLKVGESFLAIPTKAFLALLQLLPACLSSHPFLPPCSCLHHTIPRT